MPTLAGQFTPPYPAGIGVIMEPEFTSSKLRTIWASAVTMVRPRANKTGAIRVFIYSFMGLLGASFGLPRKRLFPAATSDYAAQNGRSAGVRQGQSLDQYGGAA